MLEAGAKVWHWTGVMMHAKTVVVDRCWSLVGSTNIDVLSLRRNAEINIEIHGSHVGEQMAQMFAADRSDCVPFSLDEWRARSRARRSDRADHGVAVVAGGNDGSLGNPPRSLNLRCT